MTTKAQAFMGWVDARFPMTKMWEDHMAKYYAPKNFNFWYFFGSLALLVLVLQIVTGIFLTMNYKPDATMAFASVEYIMRDVDFGWLIRYMHSTGASAFFVIVYLHMYRGLMYGSFKQPRELIWLFGMLIYLALMAEAFMGYLLPWGQMSYWGAQVIVNLFASVPFGIGEPLSVWIRGDYVVSDATLNRFFAFHVIAVPFILAGLVVAHILALHEVGSNNPDGVEIKKTKGADGIPLDGIPFHPYYSVKDIVGVVVFLMFFSAVLFFAPELGGWFLEKDNFIPANPLKTPEHIVPLWYFTPFYAILRAIPPIWESQFPGVIAMGMAIVFLFFLPWLDRHPVKSMRYREPIFKVNMFIFIVSFIVLGYLGTQPSTGILSELAFRFTELYFAFFFFLWIFSAERSTKYYITSLIVMVGTVVLLDVLRGGDAEKIAMMMKTFLIPAISFTVLLAIPAKFRSSIQAKPVPERVTS